jgi:hypothetical protein
MTAPAHRDVAQGYRARGWSVVPVRPKAKQPLVRWQALQQRLATEGEIDQWFGLWPDANIGIVTGAVSGLVVIDVDPKHGGDESLAHLERERGPLPQTVEAITGGGGRHLYFQHPGGQVRNRAGLAQGVDLRGDGGFVVAPPSVHASGRSYAWQSGHGPEDRAVAAMPAWLLERVTGRPAGRGHSLEHWRRLVRDGVAEGERNNTIASFAGHLLWRGVDPDVALELLLAWNRTRCRPPLPDAEVAAVLQSIARLHERERGDGEA